MNENIYKMSEQTGKKIGYARISDRSQKIDSQIDQLQAYGCDEIIEETITGVSWEKNLHKEIEKMEPGSALIVVRADRIARNTMMLLSVAEKLEELQIDLVVLDLNIDTRTPTGKMLLTIMAAVAQWERDQLKIKQQNGIKSAKARGVTFGPEPSFAKEGLEMAMEMYASGNYTVSHITKVTKVPRSTFYRRLKERDLNRSRKGID